MFKKFILPVVLCFSITAVTTPKAEAVVGLLLGNPTVTVIGGLTAVGGFISYQTADGSEDVVTGLAKFFGGIGVMIAGLAILEESQQAEVNFTVIRTSDVFTASELAIYNSELDELNAINQTIVAEVTANPKSADAELLWREYGASLSPKTLEIAAHTGHQLLKTLR